MILTHAIDHAISLCKAQLTVETDPIRQSRLRVALARLRDARRVADDDEWTAHQRARCQT